VKICVEKKDLSFFYLINAQLILGNYLLIQNKEEDAYREYKDILSHGIDNWVTAEATKKVQAIDGL